MKKQLTALACTLALGLAVVCGPAVGQGVEATSKIGYALATRAGAGSNTRTLVTFAGFGVGVRACRSAVVGALAARNVLTGIRIGSMVGAWIGPAGVVIGAVAGAA